MEGKKERNWKDQERERYSLLCIAAHEGCINRDKRLTAKSMHKCQRNMISQGTITKVWDLRLCRNKPYNKSPKTSWKVSLLYCACPFSFLVYNQEPYNPTFLAVISLLSFFISFFFFFLLLCITFQNNPVTWSLTITNYIICYFLSFLSSAAIIPPALALFIFKMYLCMCW